MGLREDPRPGATKPKHAIPAMHDADASVGHGGGQNHARWR